MTGPWERAFVAVGGLSGLAGVALSAAAAHVTGGGNLETAARFLLIHAPVLLVLAALIGQGAINTVIGRMAGVAIVLGLVAFCGDLSVRALYGIAPLRLAAPIGGVTLMAGWALIALAALWSRGVRQNL